MENGMHTAQERLSAFFRQGSGCAVLTGPNGSGKTALAKRVLRSFPSRKIRYIPFKDCYGGTADLDYYYQQRWNSTDISDEAILLSSGELRKRQFSRFLCDAPDVLVIDNPFIGLDAPSRDVFRQTLQETMAAGTALVLLVAREDEIPGFAGEVIRLGEDVPEPLPETLRERIAALPADTRQAAGEPVVQLRHVSLRYGDRTILGPLDLLVRSGEKWALTGPNGSGKSALLSLVCADNPQGYACDMSLFGRRRGSGESIWDIKARIGYVSPELHRAFSEDYSVERVVAGGVKAEAFLYGHPGEEEYRKAAFWMDVFGIGALAGRSYTALSDGEQRLVLLARAFARDPQLLVLDEPMHGLDGSNCARVREIITSFCARPGKTLLMVSHYEEEFPPCMTHHLDLSRRAAGL